MKQFLYIAVGCLLGIGLMLALQRSPRLHSQLPPAAFPAKRLNAQDSSHSATHSHPHDNSHTHAVMPYPESKIHRNRDTELVPRYEEPTDLTSLDADVAALKEATSDPALMKILSLYQPPAVGTINVLENNRVVLELSGGRMFQATSIGDTRSEAKDGTVALDAITVPNGRIIREVDAHDGGVSATGNPGEVWVVNSDGTASRISPEDVHAKNAIISPDGRFIAFEAQYVAENALHSKFLMIADRTTMQLSSYAARRSDPTYEIGPVDWVEDGKVLRVVENWGETGGHMTLKQISSPN